MAYTAGVIVKPAEEKKNFGVVSYLGMFENKETPNRLWDGMIFPAHVLCLIAQSVCSAPLPEPVPAMHAMIGCPI